VVFDFCAGRGGRHDELLKANASVVAVQAIQRIAWLYRIEADATALTAEQRLPTHLNSRIEESLPHKWQPVA
jgi:hypothetical protein